MENGSVKALLPVLLLAGCSTLGHQFRHLTGDAQGRLADEVVIERDAWGVPHVRGKSDAATAFGVAWAMAEDNFRELEEGYIQALGRSAYYYGERFLADDLVRAAFEVEMLARTEYAREPEAGKRLLDGFAQGLNYWLRRHPETPGRVVTRYEGWMVLARARRAEAMEQVGGVRLGEVALLLGESLAGARSELPAGPGAAWAVAPAHSASGRALLLASVAGPFSGSEQPYELELRSENGWHVYGLARLGTPIPFTGHNERLGWAHAGAADSAEVERVVFGEAADSLAYRVGERWERAESWLDTVYVNTASGVQARSYRFLRTPRGPVVARRGDTAYVVELAGFAAGGSLQQWDAMGRARSAGEFTAALGRAAIPGLATAYADVEGNILGFAGAGPPQVNPPVGEVRAGAGGAEWASLVPGGGGWTATSLARLALGTEPIAPAAEIAQLISEWEQVGGRDSRRAFAMDSAVEMLRGWDGSASPPSPADPAARAGSDSTAGRVTDPAGSTGATLYFVWRRVYGELAAGGGGGAPGATNAGAADAFPRFRALEEAVARLRRDWGGIAVPWSVVARLQRREPGSEQPFRDELPSTEVAGVPGGSLFALNTVPGDGRRRYGVSGTSAVMVTEFTEPPRSMSVSVFGQSGDPASPHYFDQAAKYGAGELKDAWFGMGPSRTRYHPGQRARVLQPETPAH